jgi:hypothetical protein
MRDEKPGMNQGRLAGPMSDSAVVDLYLMMSGHLQSTEPNLSRLKLDGMVDNQKFLTLVWVKQNSR